MNALPTFTFIRTHAMNEFHALRMRALRGSWIARLLRKKNHPQYFEDLPQPPALHTKRHAGLQEIRVDQIVGTLGRSADFDMDFRPLKKHLLERWTDAFLLLRTDGWEPITVHQVGEQYYVEDGHHRVSVSRSVGMAYITAYVWEHSQAAATESVPVCTRRCAPVEAPMDVACATHA